MQDENEKNFIKQQRNNNEKSLHFEVLSSKNQSVLLYTN